MFLIPLSAAQGRTKSPRSMAGSPARAATCHPKRRPPRSAKTGSWRPCTPGTLDIGSGRKHVVFEWVKHTMELNHNMIKEIYLFMQCNGDGNVR